MKAVYCHPAYLTMCTVYHEKCQADEAQAGIKIARRNTTTDMQVTPPLWQKAKRNFRAS